MSDNPMAGLSGEKPISRKHCCDNFLKRRSLLPGEDICWFCIYAWFKEEGAEIPEFGLCKYPVRQTN